MRDIKSRKVQGSTINTQRLKESERCFVFVALGAFGNAGVWEASRGSEEEKSRA